MKRFHKLFFLLLWQAEVDAAVKILLELKAEYKKVSGKDWKPGQTPAAAPVKDANKASALAQQLQESNTKLNQLKADSADKVSKFTCF